MKKRNLLLLACLFILLAVGFKIDSNRRAVNRQRDARQQEFINKEFDIVQRVEGGVLLKRRDFTFGGGFRGSKVFSVGDEFELNDIHVHHAYTITGITPDGVLVHYDYSFFLLGKKDKGSGTIKLHWKETMTKPGVAQ